MIMVTGHITRIPILNFSRRMAKAIPNAFAFFILIPSAFDLIGCGYSSPNKILWKLKYLFIHECSPKQSRLLYQCDTHLNFFYISIRNWDDVPGNGFSIHLKLDFVTQAFSLNLNNVSDSPVT